MLGGDDVIFPFLDVFLICKLVSPAKIFLTKKIDSGSFFSMLTPLNNSDKFKLKFKRPFYA